METLERLAPAMPNEFAADILLAVSQLPGQRTRRRRELLEEAFASASRVSEPPAPRSSLNWNRDTRAGHRQYASRPGIDALSLRVRIALAMAPLDKTRAVVMFTGIRKPQFAAGGCREPLTPDLAVYYRAMAELRRPPLPASEEARRDLETAIDRAAGEASVPAEVFDAAGMIVKLELPRERTAALVSALGGAMARMEGDFRPFVAFTAEKWQVVQELMDRLQRLSLDSRPFVAAVRRFIVTNLNTPQCRDAAARLRNRDAEAAAEALPFDLSKIPVAAGFNESVLQGAPGFDGFSAIGPDDIRITVQRDDSLDDVESFEKGRGKEILRKFQEFRTRIRRAAATGLGPGEIEDGIKALLRDMKEWAPEREEEFLDHYNEKAQAYFALIKDIPLGPYRIQALDEAGEFIEGSFARIDEKSVWFWSMQEYLTGWARESEEGVAVRELCARSRNPVMAGYALLWRLRAGSGVGR
ncbi:MAG: hypothetical protein IPM24_16920 [Bryobacterales bacterium]|nr:hypothetical protein [Bryobacterales bacterium]